MAQFSKSDSRQLADRCVHRASQACVATLQVATPRARLASPPCKASMQKALLNLNRCSNSHLRSLSQSSSNLPCSKRLPSLSLLPQKVLQLKYRLRKHHLCRHPKRKHSLNLRLKPLLSRRSSSQSQLRLNSQSKLDIESSYKSFSMANLPAVLERAQGPNKLV